MCFGEKYCGINSMLCCEAQGVRTEYRVMLICFPKKTVFDSMLWKVCETTKHRVKCFSEKECVI